MAPTLRSAFLPQPSCFGHTFHGAVIDGGNWTLASSLLPWEDPLRRDVFGGDENELAAAAAWTKSVRELQS